MDDINIYHGKDGRLRVYVKSTQKTISYPKYLMEKTIGRELAEKEEVHHLDENPLNNDVDNLVVMTKREHFKLHHPNKYFDKTAICAWCGKEFVWTAQQQSEHYRNYRRKDRNHEMSGKPFCSRACSGKYGTSIQYKKASVAK